MLESLTFLSVLSAAPTALKFAQDALDFWAKVKTIRAPAPPRPLVQSDTFTKTEKRQLDAMYAALDASRPVAADIAVRAFRFYLFIAGLVVLAIVIAAALLAWLPTTVWLIAGAAVIFLAGPALVGVLPSPVPNVRHVLNDARLTQQSAHIVRSFRAAWNDVTASAKVSVRAAGVSIPERVFLDVYFKADAVVRVLECGLLVENLETSISTVHETLTGRVFETGLDIIMRLAREKRLNDPENRQAVLSREFAAAGLGNLVDPQLVGSDFVKGDFQSLAANEDTLRNYLERYWSSQSRR